MRTPTPPPPVPDAVTTPLLRMQAGYEAARAVAERHGVSASVAWEIVAAAYDEIERGSRRVGRQCETEFKALSDAKEKAG